MQIGEDFDKSPEEKSEPPPDDGKTHVRVRCSVFFDGTLNNRTNTESRQSGSAIYEANRVESADNSYENDLTNVAKMEKYIDKGDGFDHSLSVYVEGPGTEDNDDDATMGYAFGTGDTGVKAKVAIGITKVMAKISKEVPKKFIIDELVLDVFGFSRGAAGARFFIHEALNEEPTYVNVGHGGIVTILAQPIFQRLQNSGYEISPNNVEFHFVGLYDTVASYGVPHWDDGTRLLKLDSLKRSAVKHVIHLAAADEHRANFPLTHIDSAAGKSREIFLPGVHSDIGGSYLASSNEGASKEDALTINRDYSESALEADRQKLIGEGWYKPGEISVENASFAKKYLIPGAHIVPSKPAQHRLKVYRTNIGHDYDKIPLNIMADFAKEHGVNLSFEFKSEEKVSSCLKKLFDTLKAYANSGNSRLEDWFNKTGPKWLTDLRHDYLHFSAHYTLTKGVIAANKPLFEGGRRVRGTHEG